MIKWLRYANGMWRLRYGCCPVCNSSPPEPICPICHGDYRYGPRMTTTRKELWRRRFREVLDL
jgi:hypothetical protein